MAHWADDPDVQRAIARAAEITAILALPEAAALAALAARSLYPVSVAYGELDHEEAVDLVCRRMAETAGQLGCRHTSGGNDATTYLFPSHLASVQFLAEVTGFAEPWWTVTATAKPVYNRGGGW